MAAYWPGGTPPRKTSVSLPRLMPDRSVRTSTSSGPRSGSVTGRISPEPGLRSQNAFAPPRSTVTRDPGLRAAAWPRSHPGAPGSSRNEAPLLERHAKCAHGVATAGLYGSPAHEGSPSACAAALLERSAGHGRAVAGGCERVVVVHRTCRIAQLGEVAAGQRTLVNDRVAHAAARRGPAEHGPVVQVLQVAAVAQDIADPAEVLAVNEEASGARAGDVRAHDAQPAEGH